MKIEIAICDDQEFFLDELEAKIKRIDFLKDYEYNIYTYTSSEEMIEFAKKNVKFDLVFIDIELNNGTLGTNVGLLLKEINPDTLLIYVSGYDKYYTDLVSAEPFAFLKKPVEDCDIRAILNKVIERLLYLNQDFFYSFKFNGIIYRVDLKNVMYFESQHRVINVHFNDKTVLQFYGKLDEVENDINKQYPYFVRVSKSYYINSFYVKKINHSFVVINDVDIRIGQKYKDSALKKLVKLIKKKI